MKQASFLIKPASSICNLCCSYCFYQDVSANRENANMGIMEEKVMFSLIDKALNLSVDKINFCFQGGEPMMAGLSYFNKFIDYVNLKNTSKVISYSIQTNGTLIDDSWIQIFHKNHFLVGISLDGFMENNNKFRKDKQKKGTFKTIIHAIKKLEKAHIEYNILTVLTHDLSKKPKQLFDFYQTYHFKYVQLIPCLPTLEGNPVLDRHALTPKDFAYFYKCFFDYWYDEYAKGNYLSVTLFDNLIPMYLNIAPSQCGMLGKCQIQFVVEGNGNVYPCDFYVLDKYCCGNIVTNEIEEILNSAASKLFLTEARKKYKGCDTCTFKGMCHGNCKRLSVCYYDESMCGYQEFLQYSKERMIKIAKNLR